MKRIHTQQATLLLIATTAAILAASVFLWGTEYKLSLYPQGRTARVAIPYAKLLSERERPAVVHVNLATFRSLAAPTLALILCAPAIRDSRKAFTFAAPALFGDPAVSHLFRFPPLWFRPPPAPAL